jgi:hypothetical protein
MGQPEGVPGPWGKLRVVRGRGRVDWNPPVFDFRVAFHQGSMKMMTKQGRRARRVEAEAKSAKSRESWGKILD